MKDLKYFIVLIFLSFSRFYASASFGTRVSVGSEVTSFWTRYTNHEGLTRDKVKIHAMQKDEWRYGNILVAAGSALYTVSSDGSTSILLAGSLNAASSVFNQTAGIAQIRNGAIVLISDRYNRCIRQLSRSSGTLSVYAGQCGSRAPSYIGYSDQWKKFYEPRQMHYDTKTSNIYLVDGYRNNKVISKNIYTGNTRLVKQMYDPINDIVYDPHSDSFVASFAVSNNVKNFSRTGYASTIRTSDLPQPFGLAFSKGILIITDKSSGGSVKVVESRNKNALFKLCSSTYLTTSYYTFPYCLLNYPSAVAVIDDKLFIGDLDDTGFKVGPRIKTVRFVVGNSDTTTTKRYTTTTNSYGFEDESSNEYVSHESGSNTGATVGIIFACIAAVGLKITCIGCCIYRWNYRLRYRQRHCHGRTTVVSVTSSTPYGRLEEPAIPTMHGQFPVPPPYSASMVGPAVTPMPSNHGQPHQQLAQQSQQLPPPYTPKGPEAPNVRY